MKLRAVGGIVLAAVLCCFSALAGAAPALPSADGEIRGIEQNQPRQSSPPLVLDAVGKSMPLHNAAQRIRVQSFVFSGQGELPVKLLEQALAEFTGRDLTMSDLYDASAKAAAVCRANGYPAVTAYLPVQDVQDGAVQIKIVIAKTEAVELVDRSSLVRGRAQDFAAMKEGETLTNAQLEETALALGALSGVDSSLLLLPGESEGAVRVQLRAQDGKPVAVTLFSDNSGTKYTGRYRYGIMGAANNMDRMGGMLQLSGVRSNGDMRNYAARYETPLGNRGGKFGLLYARSDYSLSDQFAVLGATGLADTVSVYGSIPLRQSYRNTASLNYGFDRKELTDRLDALRYETKKSANVWHLGLTGKHVTDHSVTNAALVYYDGRLSMDNAEARAADAYADTAGRFHKGTLDLYHLENLSERVDLSLAFHGQAASRNLDSSEQFYLGGMNGVRAYAQGEASGDSGYQATAEFRCRTPWPHVSLLAFVDTGRVELVKSGDAHRSLSGWGLGVQYALPDNFYARADYSWKINAKEDLSEGRNNNGRAWFQIYKMI